MERSDKSRLSISAFSRFQPRSRDSSTSSCGIFLKNRFSISSVLILRFIEFLLRPSSAFEFCASPGTATATPGPWTCPALQRSLSLSDPSHGVEPHFGPFRPDRCYGLTQALLRLFSQAVIIDRAL